MKLPLNIIFWLPPSGKLFSHLCLYGGKYQMPVYVASDPSQYDAHGGSHERHDKDCEDIGRLLVRVLEDLAEKVAQQSQERDAEEGDAEDFLGGGHVASNGIFFSNHPSCFQ